MSGELFKSYIQDTIDLRKSMLTDSLLEQSVEELVAVITDAVKAGRKIIFFGNGGSAADAQHLAAEFVSRFKFDRAPLPSIALTVDTSCLTAIGNDYGFDKIFERQVMALVNSDDVVIGISTSGTSPNVINGLKAARLKGAKTISFTGSKGIACKCDYTLSVPSFETAMIQEIHISIGHYICGRVESNIFNSDECK